MAFVIRHGGAAVPLMGKAAYSYGQYQRQERRAARQLQERMQEKSLQAREDSQIRGIQAQQDRDVEIANRRTKEMEQGARIGREAAEHEYDLREGFADKKAEIRKDQMEFGLEQKKDLFDYDYSERDKRRIAELDAQHQQIEDLERRGTLSPQEAQDFHEQIDLARAGVQRTKKKQWPEGKGVGQMWELGQVGSGMYVTRKPDGTVAKLFDTRQIQQGEIKEQAKRMADARKVLGKLQGERRKYLQGLEKETVKDPLSEKVVSRYTKDQKLAMAAEKFGDAIFSAQTALVDARLGTEPEAPLRPMEGPGEAGQALPPLLGGPPATAPVAPMPEEQRRAEMGTLFGGAAAPEALAPIPRRGAGGMVAPEASAEAAFGGPRGGVVDIPALLQKYEALAQQGKLSEREQAVYERLKALSARGVGAR